MQQLNPSPTKLLNKVQHHLKQVRQYNQMKKQRQQVQEQQIDTQVQQQIEHLQYYLPNDADMDHQRLIDQCVKDILRNNTPLEPMTQRQHRNTQSLSLLTKSPPKFKRLRSTMLVDAMIQAKGIQKKTIQQQKADYINKILNEKRMNTLPNEQKLPSIISPIRIKRASHIDKNHSPLRSQRKITSKNESPQFNDRFEKFSAISKVSDEGSPNQSMRLQSIEPILNRQSQTRKSQANMVKLLICNINNEKDQILSQQRSIRKSIISVKRTFDDIIETAFSNKNENQMLIRQDRKLNK